MHIINSSYILQEHVNGEQALADQQRVSDSMKMQPSLKAWRKKQQQGESPAAVLEEHPPGTTAPRVSPSSQKPRWITHEQWLRLGKSFAAWNAYEHAVQVATHEGRDDPGAPPPGPPIPIASFLDFMCVTECMLPPGTLEWPLSWHSAKKAGNAPGNGQGNEQGEVQGEVQEADEQGHEEEGQGAQQELQEEEVAAELEKELAEELEVAQDVLEPEGDQEEEPAEELEQQGGDPMPPEEEEEEEEAEAGVEDAAIEPATWEPASPMYTEGWRADAAIPPRMKAQHRIAEQLHRRRQTLYRVSLLQIRNVGTRQESVARHLSQSSRVAGAWLHLKPTGFQRLSHRSHVSAIHRLLHVNPEYAHPCHKHPAGGLMDEVHTRTCSLTGLQNLTHDGLQHVLARDIMRGLVGLGGVREKDRAPFHPPPLIDGAAGVAHPGGPGRGREMDSYEMDVTTPSRVLDLPEDDEWHGKGLLVDLSMGEPAARSHRRKAARQQGHLTADRADVKYRHYQPELFDARAQPLFDSDVYALVPFVVETYGCIGMYGHSLLHKLARQCAGGTLEYDHNMYNAALREMRVRLAVGLQRLLFERSQRHRSLAAPRCTRPRPSHAPPAVS
jgi:hypothetical protein